MFDLAFAYMISALVVGLLLFFATQNRKQGWVRNRSLMREVHVAEATVDFEPWPDVLASRPAAPQEEFSAQLEYDAEPELSHAR
jgi:hypothetical protein